MVARIFHSTPHSSLTFVCVLLVVTACLSQLAVSDSAAEEGSFMVARKPQPGDLEAFDRAEHHRMLKHHKGGKHKHQKKTADGGVRPLRMLVKYKDDKGKEEAILKAKAVYHEFESDHVMAIELDQDGIEELELSADIESIEEDSIWTAQGIFEEYVDMPSKQDHEGNLRGRELQDDEEIVPYGIRLTQADTVEVGNYPTSVCIVDTGLADDHPDIDSSLTSGYDRRSNIDSGQWLRWNKDPRGHGTHISGTIAAAVGNGIGVRGMGKIPVVITRGLNNDGDAYESDVREAIEQCQLAGARVISLSLSGSSASNSMVTLLRNLYDDGVLILAAAGNSGKWQKDFPASLDSVVSVAAVKQNQSYWPDSNYGPWLDLTAPGHRILSTSVNGRGQFTYARYSGTSMATPHAAAAAAILWSHYPLCTNHQIKYVLAATAKDLGPSGCDTDYGYGLIQVKAGLDFLEEWGGCGPNTNWGKQEQRGFCRILDEAPQR